MQAKQTHEVENLKQQEEQNGFVGERSCDASGTETQGPAFCAFVVGSSCLLAAWSWKAEDI